MGVVRRFCSSSWAPTLGLVAIGLVYLIVQIPVIRAVPLRWDEVLYLGQTSSAMPAPYFSAPRAFGEAWLVSPVSVWTSSPTIIRAYVAFTSSIGFVVAFLPWIRVRGLGRWNAPLAASILLLSWIWVISGSLIFPNLWVAFGAVSAIGWAVLAVQNKSKLAIAATACSLAVVALFRPVDSLVVFVGVTLCLLIMIHLGSWKWRGLAFASLVFGLIVGWVPWVIDAFQRFGGPQSRLLEASEFQGGRGKSLDFLAQWRALDGPMLCKPCLAIKAGFPIAGTTLLVLALSLVVLAVIVSIRGRVLPVLASPVVVGIAFLAFYGLTMQYGAPRFLLPMWGCFAIAVAYSVTWLWGVVSGRALLLIRIPVACVAIAVLIMQVGVLAHTVATERSRGAFAPILANQARSIITEPCGVAGYYALPIAFGLHCHLLASKGDRIADGDWGQIAADLTIVIVCFPGQKKCAFPLNLPHKSKRFQYTGGVNSDFVVVEFRYAHSIRAGVLAQEGTAS
ncbi:unannotated protein [freshwater metagenome]|uniref:Unannotated protein n=1 Tax=freshwater metagenome TaxID=449393 RepID=A0A6J7G4Q9_9ZZZZ|nr:hypothetical protein [Actinomycetota bacterium]